MVQLVTWPVAGLEWHDTHEGGMHCMLVIPEDPLEDEPFECHVETDIYVHLPDARVSDCGDLWDPYDSKDQKTKFATHRRLQDAGEHEMADWAMRAWSQYELSNSCLVAMHIGSTHESLFHHQGGAFEAEYKHLTGAGQMLYDLIKSAYGREPKILTFLDT